MKPMPPKLVRFLADEFHSESWSVSEARAAEMAPEAPGNSSYARAAKLLAERDFIVRRNTEGPLTRDVLANADVVALVHPCDPRWERTTSGNPPSLQPEEIADLLAWVKAGGGLLVISEYEHAKYGDNLNELLAAAGLRIENGKVVDRSACVPGNPEWIYAAPVADSPLGHGVAQACFFRAGWLSAEPPGQLIWRASAQAYPPGAGLIGCAELGAGRVAVVTDSVLFGDERIDEGDHRQLWLNLAHWLAAPAYAKKELTDGGAGDSRKTKRVKSAAETLEWERVKGLMGTLRAIQHGDGSVEMPSHDGALKVMHAVVPELGRLAAHFPHQAEYFAQLVRDLEAWANGGFGRPDFAASLALFHPEKERFDGLEHLALFPMYTPNASMEVRFEALIVRTFWPDWLAELERGAYPNPKFVPLQLVDYTAGYASECAVLFPETVSVAGKASNHFGGIFCDREAARLQSAARRAAAATGLSLFPELECLLGNRELLLNVCALWDLIHDRGHALGELPFDPFMIRQRAPFWMYGLEELRVDLNAFVEADRLDREGFPFARYVCWAIVLDRIFRFPITGLRVRNYDALGGQLLFAALHQHDAIVWRDNRLTLRWEELPRAMAALRNEVLALYKLGADCSRVSFWMAAHALVSRYLRPNVASRWLGGGWPEENDLKAWLGRVHEDEFPLGNFHVNLIRRMK